MNIQFLLRRLPPDVSLTSFVKSFGEGDMPTVFDPAFKKAWDELAVSDLPPSATDLEIRAAKILSFLSYCRANKIDPFVVKTKTPNIKDLQTKIFKNNASRIQESLKIRFSKFNINKISDIKKINIKPVIFHSGKEKAYLFYGVKPKKNIDIFNVIKNVFNDDNIPRKILKAHNNLMTDVGDSLWFIITKTKELTISMGTTKDMVVFRIELPLGYEMSEFPISAKLKHSKSFKPF